MAVIEIDDDIAERLRSLSRRENIDINMLLEKLIEIYVPSCD
jgi:hypothetical protein